MRKKRNNPIKPKKSFGIVVDGETEVWYLQMLKRNERALNINIEPKIPQRKKLSDQFETVKMLAEDYTKVFWIVDYDVIISETEANKKGTKSAELEFNEYRNLLSEIENVQVIVNNPCLEFWFLLHFTNTSRLFRDCLSAEKELKNI